MARCGPTRVRGLFVQYLGRLARSWRNIFPSRDVRRYYEARSRFNRRLPACRCGAPVMYCVEQKYETGQAIPVTGGQVMLN